MMNEQLYSFTFFHFALPKYLNIHIALSENTIIYIVSLKRLKKKIAFNT